MRIIIHRLFYFAPAAACLLIGLFAFAARSVCAQRSKSAAKSAPRSSGRSNPGADATIAPGTGVGTIKIGDALEEVFKKYPKTSRTYYTPTSRDCPVARLEMPGNSLTLYLTGGRISQIEADYPLGAPPITSEGIKPGSTAATVKKYFSGADQAYTDLGGGSAAIGYLPPIYWVDRKSGIAFMFSTDSRLGRVVYGIYVFAPGEKVIFGGPCETNEDLRELSPFATEVPQKMIDNFYKNN